MHQKQTKTFFLFLLGRNYTFVGLSHTQGNIFFWNLKWAFSDILIHFQWSNLIFVELIFYFDIVKLYQINESISQQKYKNSFVHFWCKWKKGKNSFRNYQTFSLVIHLTKVRKYVYPWPIISSTIAVYLMSLYSVKEWKVAAMCTQLFCQSQTTSCKAKLLHITLGSTVCFLPIYTFIQSSISKNTAD